ncbi:type IV secretion system protein [Escherichia coli]|uniref:type IV secretion system protein n=1 Tax=Escherichia coli TaxID=562 RepID=UPI0021CFA8ED|nr:type IV secretion system protein [Escherichia coli]MCQ5512814.1 type IV secretion system protein [Escherichia coli]MCQ5518031.1 type IV secretion system protein [Escherichia coli]MCQ5553219.1 type IV secretion system protein [Escherichia coli]MCQ5564482.1 type IV secretion system protein [Escherichia coli]MCQ5584699.1 type IV secretion system protein [Escherichia coli]
MKKLLTIVLSGILTVTSPSLFASIPVVDASSIAKTVEEGLNRAAEAAKQLEQLKQQYEQAIKYAEEQKKRLEGFTDFSHGFDSTSSYMKDSLSSITNSAKSNLNSLRSQYELSSNVAETQQRYDAILAKIKFYENFNNEMQERAKRITNLQKDFASADTPQKKADLSNQLNTEKLTMELQLKQYDIAERQLENERKAQYEAYIRQKRRDLS